MTSGKKNDIGETPGPMNRNFDRNLVRTSLDNPSFMEGRPPSGSLNRDINGAKSTKIFARQAEDVISGRSVMEPAIMQSARSNKHGISALETRSRSSMGAVAKSVNLNKAKSQK